VNKCKQIDHCALLELRYLNFVSIVNPEQVRSRTFRVNDLLLYLLLIVQYDVACLIVAKNVIGVRITYTGTSIPCQY
jgi:hypothetical protein